MEILTFDYIIIGSGSSGSALAYRISENKKYTIAVVEFGGNDWGPLIQMPAALSYPMNSKLYDWEYFNAPPVAKDPSQWAKLIKQM